MAPPSATSPMDLNVSLEPHLLDVLRPLPPLLPPNLAVQLTPVVFSSQPSPSPSISYALLSSISRWARSPAGQAVLRSHSPSLQLHDYTMVSLLVGTRTSPGRKFPLAPTCESQAIRKKELNDQRAVTALLNALLSIAGSGAATWWAAERLSWKNEWRVLLALLVSVIVAASEIILFLIWDARRSTTVHKNGFKTQAGRQATFGPKTDRMTLASSSAVDMCINFGANAKSLTHRDGKVS